MSTGSMCMYVIKARALSTWREETAYKKKNSDQGFLFCSGTSVPRETGCASLILWSKLYPLWCNLKYPGAAVNWASSFPGNIHQINAAGAQHTPATSHFSSPWTGCTINAGGSGGSRKDRYAISRATGILSLGTSVWGVAAASQFHYFGAREAERVPPLQRVNKFKYRFT